MKIPSKAEPGNYAALIQELKKLEIEWKSLKQRRPIRNKRPPRTSSSESDSILTSFDELVLENSPRGLMSCLQLQHNKSKSSPNYLLLKKKLKQYSCHDMAAVEEIVLSDRRAAGKLKGRRLFQDSDNGEIIITSTSTDWLNNISHEREVKVMMINEKRHDDDDDELSVANFDQSSSCSFSGDDSSVSDEKVVVEEEKRSSGDGNKQVSGRGYMAWFAFVLIFVTLGLIIYSMSCCCCCNGKLVEEKELMMIPT